MRNAAASYANVNGTAHTDVEELFNILHNAAMTADRSQHSQEAVEERASRGIIMELIESGLEKFGQDDRPRTKSRLTKGTEPHYKANPITIDEADLQMDAMIRGML